MMGILLLAACGNGHEADRAANHATIKHSQLPTPAPPQARESIGAATMDAKGTITLRLGVNQPGMIGDGVLIYRKDNLHYRDILQHIGPLVPGKSVPLYPWPD